MNLVLFHEKFIVVINYVYELMLIFAQVLKLENTACISPKCYSLSPTSSPCDLSINLGELVLTNRAPFKVALHFKTTEGETVQNGFRSGCTEF